MTLPPNVMSRIEATGFCWLWTGKLEYTGYARVVVKQKRYMAHRLVYERLVGPIPEGLVLDHLCRVRHCVNPDHLEPVTQGENTSRGAGPWGALGLKSHCPRGHEFTPENTARWKNSGRACLECNRQRCISYYRSRSRAVAQEVTTSAR